MLQHRVSPLFSLLFKKLSCPAAILLAALFCLPCRSAGIEPMSETESRGVTAASGFALSGGFLSSLLTNAAEDFIIQSQDENGTDEDSGAEKEKTAAYRLLSFMTGMTDADWVELLKHADIRAGRCDLLTLTHQQTAGTDEVINGFTIGLPEFEIKHKPETIDLKIPLPGADNAGKSFGQIERGPGRIQILGGTVEVANH